MGNEDERMPKLTKTAVQPHTAHLAAVQKLCTVAFHFEQSAMLEVIT